ncbi:MAG TPA: hypothetical protein EYO61_03300 [Campylobacterales bacterium]|nr:hypothetical protein [Campylobacterales bacterium]HIO70448.1 hypothetical protein [Campylobacterales bacterium]
MQITRDENVITIHGNIKSVSDYTEIQGHLQAAIANGNTSITIKIVDSISITSSVIGIFLKVIKKDGVNLTVLVGNKHLYDLLNELNLLAVFNVRQL